MNGKIRHLVFSLVIATASMAGAVPRALAQDAPELSSSLAKNLWRQAHFYFEEGMDAKGIRACEELQAWARENNEPAIEKEMTDMLTELRARQQAPAAPATPSKQAAPAMQSNLPACGYGSVSDMPSNIVNRIITRTPEEFLACDQDEDCTVAYNFCGTSKAINKTSRECYESVARQFDISAGCGQIDFPDGKAVCRNRTCMIQY